MRVVCFYLNVLVCLLSGAAVAQKSSVHLIFSTENVRDSISLANYSLGQGGLSAQPMIDLHAPQLAQLQPKFIRFFVQEYFGLYPAKGKYQWDQLDKMLEAIIASGARPMPAICFKPALLFPTIDPAICSPSNYAEWDQLIYQLVKHCAEKKYGIEYWEIGNEVDIGENGGSPYLFKPAGYLDYYTHTARAIRRAQPHSKVGGPALADYNNAIGDYLIAYCGKGKAPLNFFSWHGYNNSPDFFRQSVKHIKAKLGQFSSLKNTETIITEWNMDIFEPILSPNFQPAFILEVTKTFLDEGLDASAYYHIRDYFVDPKEFRPFFSKAGAGFMAHWWNVMPQYCGIFDNHGRVRPSYYVFQWMSLLKGSRLVVAGEGADIKSLAAKDGNYINMLVWNFPSDGKGKTVEVTIAPALTKHGSFRVVRLNAERAVNNVEVLRSGSTNLLLLNTIKVELAPYEICWVEINN